MTIRDLKTAKENFSIVEKRNERNNLIIVSPIENLMFETKENGEKYITRNYRKTTKVSDHYFPVPDSYILKSLFDQDYFDSIIPGIERIRTLDNGGFHIMFNETKSELSTVLDVSKTRERGYSNYFLKSRQDVLIETKPMGDYKKTILINNSFDKSKRFSITLGLLRLICTNGMYALKESENNFISGKILHLDVNKEKIMTGISTMLSKIPYLIQEADLLQEMKNQQIANDIKAKYLKDSEEYLKERYDIVSLKNHEDQYSQYFLTFIEIIKEVMDRANTMLDFVNVMSYFLVEKRFASTVSGTATVLVNKMKKLYNESNN